MNFEFRIESGSFSMKVSHLLRAFLLGVLLSLFTQQTSAQSNAPTSSPMGNSSQTMPRNSDGPNPLITIGVVVTNKSGTPQAGLQQQDFTLLDNKISQKIVSFQAIEDPTIPATQPAEVILFMDTVNATTQTVSDERLQITRYLQRNGGKLNYPTSIVVFSDSGLKNLGEPTRDGNALSSILAGKDVIGLRSIHRAAGANGASERLVSSLRNLYSIASFQANKPGRKILIWISPGWPASGTEMFSEVKEQLFSTLVLVSTALQQARVTLYSIDPEGAAGGLRNRFSYQSYLKPITAAKYVSPANMSLPVLVTHSGGLVLTTGNDIGAQIDDCTSDIKAYYVISFQGVPTERPDEYHAIELKVDKPGLTVRTSAGYYAQAEQRPLSPEE
jgi:VWFA-related protein